MKSWIIKEEWKDIEGFEGLYQVSNLGRIKSLDRYVNDNGGIRLKKGKIMKPKQYKCGYIDIQLSNGRVKHFLIHRLVAEAFIPNPDNLPQVNHKNECKWDNAVWNLEWCTRKYNQNYGKRNVKASISMTNNPKKSKPVLQYTLDGQFVDEYPSVAEANRQTGVYSSNIHCCCKGRDYGGYIIKQAGGYIWKYKEQIGIEYVS